MNRFVEVFGEKKRLARTRSVHHAISVASQNRRADCAHLLFVFDEENRLRAARRSRRSRSKRGWRLVRARQVDLEGRATTWLAEHADVPMTLLHDAEHRR